jgi:hypothetical protein
MKYKVGDLVEINKKIKVKGLCFKTKDFGLVIGFQIFGGIKTAPIVLWNDGKAASIDPKDLVKL